jgi:2-oxoglutarate/2-oxoacid ferredoxin oxidoreductase subunit beta
MAETNGAPDAPEHRGITEASGGVATLTRGDFVSDQEVRWCPGCGDYAILAAVQSVMPTLGIPREKIVFISGIGCSSRFPYYMDTYGLHGIHGRAPAIATGLATARPDLNVWVVTGDGDGLSIGGNHLIHALRRNVNLKILLFNNQIYGLTKGQYSPTSEKGKVTKSTPFGSLETPFNPISLALAAEATFVARTYDVERKHLPQILKRAADHRGSAFVEIYQNCNIFNDGAFIALTSKGGGSNRVYLQHGQPIRFGADDQKGVIMQPDGSLKIVDVGSVGEDKLLVHDEHRDDPSLAYALSRLAAGPTMPTPLGVFRQIERPVYGDGMESQLRAAAEQQGPGDLARLLVSGDTWTVN